MLSLNAHPIGTPGQPWGAQERALWRSRQSRKRSYAADVLSVIEALRGQWEVVAYGRIDCPSDSGPLDSLPLNSNRSVGGVSESYPLLALKSLAWRDDLPSVLVTGGVHGYETSGVHGALQFAREHAAEFAGRVNLLIAPCVSPWAYERVHRWNADAVDPNRSFREGSAVAESAALMRLVAPLVERFVLHIDLHETTDTDESEFRPALAARDGKPHTPGAIPDGFYLVGDSENPQLAFQSAVIAEVAKVTHIAPADGNAEIIAASVVAPGVILYPFKALGLCAGLTKARYTSTTEVYPDSARATPEQCNQAQVAAIRAAIAFALSAG